VQFAIAGVNPHINRDLAHGIMAVCEARDVVPRRGSPEHADYEAITPMLSETLREVKDWLEGPALELVDRTFGDVDDRVALWSVAHARDCAWTQAETLACLPPGGHLRTACASAWDRTSSLAGGILLV
jgi:hypothetical protein